MTVRAALVWVLAFSSCATDGRGRDETVGTSGSDTVTIVGCVELRGGDAPLLLWIVDSPEPAAGTGVGQSTTTTGAWVGTRQLELVGDQVESIAQHAGHRVRVTGTIEAPHLSTGATDQVKFARGVEFHRLVASSAEPVEGVCAFDPRRRGESPPGDPDIH